MPRQRTTMNTSNDLASPPTGVDARGKQDGKGDGVDFRHIKSGGEGHLVGFFVVAAHDDQLMEILYGRVCLGAFTGVALPTSCELIYFRGVSARALSDARLCCV